MKFYEAKLLQDYSRCSPFSLVDNASLDVVFVIIIKIKYLHRTIEILFVYNIFKKKKENDYKTIERC